MTWDTGLCYSREALLLASSQTYLTLPWASLCNAVLCRHIVKQILCAFNELAEKREGGKRPCACTCSKIFALCFVKCKMALWDHRSYLKRIGFFGTKYKQANKRAFFSLTKFWKKMKEEITDLFWSEDCIINLISRSIGRVCRKQTPER